MHLIVDSKCKSLQRRLDGPDPNGRVAQGLVSPGYDCLPLKTLILSFLDPGMNALIVVFSRNVSYLFKRKINMKCIYLL